VLIEALFLVLTLSHCQPVFINRGRGERLHFQKNYMGTDVQRQRVWPFFGQSRWKHVSLPNSIRQDREGCHTGLKPEFKILRDLVYYVVQKLIYARLKWF